MSLKRMCNSLDRYS